MGSALCSQEWAANRLNLTKRSVRSLVQRGLLKKQIVEGEVLYDQVEVEQLASERGTDYPVLNRRTFIELQTRLTKMEQDMAVVRRSMDISANPLRPTAHEAAQLYRAAGAALAAGKWTLEEMESWASIYDRLDEPALALIGEVAVEDKPWEVFFRLCTSQMLQVGTDKGFTTTLKLQEIHKKLDEGRKKLRGSILVWIELQRGNPAEKALQAVENGVDDLKRRISGRNYRD